MKAAAAFLVLWRSLSMDLRWFISCPSWWCGCAAIWAGGARWFLLGTSPAIAWVISLWQASFRGRDYRRRRTASTDSQIEPAYRAFHRWKGRMYLLTAFMASITLSIWFGFV